ncbi:hypothetical protein EDD22DRAFT_1006756 [Suillus occidentalis]|nr:hypothetical protein EDD22DRAFT_1006756 [Suillus occidentalis]
MGVQVVDAAQLRQGGGLLLHVSGTQLVAEGARTLPPHIRKRRLCFDPSAPSAPFHSLIIADRTVDMITPLLTQLMYEGLIDGFIGSRTLMSNCQEKTQQSRVAHRLDEDYKARLQAKTVAQLRDFVGKPGDPRSECQDELADTHAELAKQHALCEKLETDLLALNINGGSGPREEGDENGPIFALKACF